MAYYTIKTCYKYYNIVEDFCAWLTDWIYVHIYIYIWRERRRKTKKDLPRGHYYYYYFFISPIKQWYRTQDSYRSKTVSSQWNTNTTCMYIGTRLNMCCVDIRRIFKDFFTILFFCFVSYRKYYNTTFMDSITMTAVIS